MYEETEHVMDTVDDSLEELDEELREKFLALLGGLEQDSRLYDLPDEENDLQQDYYPQVDEEEMERRLMEEYAYR